MAPIKTLLHSARIFLGPDTDLWGAKSLWVVICEGSRTTVGYHGDYKGDEKFLVNALGEHDTRKDAAQSLIYKLNNNASYYVPSHGSRNNNLDASTPPIWTVDFDQNHILCDRDGLHLIYEFELPDNRPIRLRHFKPYIPQSLPTPQPSTTVSRYCSWDYAPPDAIPQRLFDFVYRIIHDYDYNWRNCGYTVERYGIQQLGMGILSCFTLNFKGLKVCMRQLEVPFHRERPRGEKLLTWRAWPTPPVIPTANLGNTFVLFTEKMDEATMLVNDHFHTEIVLRVLDPPQTIYHYIVSSMAEVQYFQKNSSTMSCTPKITFLDGQNPPNEKAVRLILNAIHGHGYPLNTLIHKLPLELQEMVLDYLKPRGDIDKAIYAAILDIGLPFEWKEQNEPLVLCPLTTRDSDRWELVDFEKTEYQILFWDQYVPLSYQAGAKTNDQGSSS